MNHVTTTANYVSPTPPIPGDWELFLPWFNPLRRIRKEYSGVGITVVTTVTIIDDHGNPLLWDVIHASRLEPGARAEDTLRELLRHLAGKE